MKPNNEPDLMALYLRHCAMGFVLSAVFVAMLLWRDVAGLGTLIAGSDVGVLAVFLLWFFHGTVFGGVQFALMIMLQSDDHNDDDDHHRGRMIPVRVTQSAAGRRP
jgi:hypothetical protein